MNQYEEKIKKLFRRQSGVSVSQRKEEINIYIDYSDVGEGAGDWIHSTVALIEGNIPELEKSDYGCHEIVYVKFKEKEEVRKQQLQHEIVYFTLEEPECGGKHVSLEFPLQEDGFEDYVEFYVTEEPLSVHILYNFYEKDNEPKLIIEGKWAKPVHEEYDAFEKRIRQTIQLLEERIKSEIKHTTNWEALSDEDPVRNQILKKYALQEEPYSEESEKKLEKIIHQ